MKKEQASRIIQMVEDGGWVNQYYLRGEIFVTLDGEREFMDYSFFSEDLRKTGLIEKVRRVNTTRDYDKHDVYRKPAKEVTE